MQPADTAIVRSRAIALSHSVIAGWGGGPGASVTIVRPEGVGELRIALRSAAHVNAVPRGMGRSYGDAAQISGGLVVVTTRLKRIRLDAERGTVTAQAGVTIGELLREVVPAGWMVPVVPGTQHVTVGGAIASDVHGKNHGAAGTFGTHVEAISLLQADGELVELQPGMSDRQFEATLGGMGLTGIIIDARIKLTPIQGAMLSVDTDRVRSLDDALAALAARGGPHRVAWLDLLSASPGRGVVTRADHTDAPGEGAAVVRSRATVPRGWPAGALRPATVRAFNALKYARAPRTERGRPEPLGRHMFPLDSIDAWSRLYGPRGFLQYQLAVPTGAERVLELVIERLRRGRVPCYLAVLKDFGPANGAPLSFPLEGWTLALDIPRAAPELEPLLESLDRMVAEAGGRVYLSKDARLRPETVRAMYPRLDEWRAARNRADPERVWCSDLARRVGLL
jgi:decaprenylphospho-beta-D-ribofuranose 2-oxidase